MQKQNLWNNVNLLISLVVAIYAWVVHSWASVNSETGIAMHVESYYQKP